MIFGGNIHPKGGGGALIVSPASHQGVTHVFLSNILAICAADSCVVLPHSHTSGGEEGKMTTIGTIVYPHNITLL